MPADGDKELNSELQQILVENDIPHTLGTTITTGNIF